MSDFDIDLANIDPALRAWLDRRASEIMKDEANLPIRERQSWRNAPMREVDTSKAVQRPRRTDLEQNSTAKGRQSR